MDEKQKLDQHTMIRLTVQERRVLETLARKEGRSVSAQARLMLRRSLAAQLLGGGEELAA